MGKHRRIQFDDGIVLESIEPNEDHPACVAVREQQADEAAAFCRARKVVNVIRAAKTGLIVGAVTSSGLQIGWPATCVALGATAAGWALLKLKTRKVKPNGSQVALGEIIRD